MKDMLSNYVLGAIACIVMGIALIVQPHIITDVLNTAVGVILIVWAVIGIIRFIMSKAKDSASSDKGIMSLLGNIILLAGGIYVFINTSLLETVAMSALGLYLLFSGVPKLIDSVQLRNISPKWKTPLITSALTVILGLAVILMPRLIAGEIMRLVGVVLVGAGIACFISGNSASGILKKHERDEVRAAKSAAKNGNKVLDVDYTEED